MTATGTVSRCPQCGSAALGRVRSDPPWCTVCEWNLDEWPGPPSNQTRAQRRRRRAVLRYRRRAFEINRALLGEWHGIRPDRPTRTRADVLLGTTSAVLLLLDLALLVGGIVLFVNGTWPERILAVVMVLVSIECRLRFNVLPTGGAVSRQEAPRLWAMIDRARASLGAPEVDVLLIDNTFNAYCGRSGLRRRVVVSLGLPLWGSLSPAARQALLGHELGHLVNGDPTTSIATQPALTTFGRLADAFDPSDLVDSDNVVAAFFGTIVAYTVFYPLHLLCRQAHRGLVRVAARDHQRAEVYADALAVRLGGTDGAAELMRVLLFAESATRALRRTAASTDPAEWQLAVTDAVGREVGERRIAEQRALRYDAWLFASHPPIGLRSRLVHSWPAAPPAAAPESAADVAAADRELARRYASARRAIDRGELR